MPWVRRIAERKALAVRIKHATGAAVKVTECIYWLLPVRWHRWLHPQCRGATMRHGSTISHRIELVAEAGLHARVDATASTRNMAMAMAMAPTRPLTSTFRYHCRWPLCSPCLALPLVLLLPLALTLKLKVPQVS